MQICCLAVSMLWCSLFVADLLVGMEDLELHHRCGGRSNFRKIRVATVSVRMVGESQKFPSSHENSFFSNPSLRRKREYFERKGKQISRNIFPSEGRISLWGTIWRFFPQNENSASKDVKGCCFRQVIGCRHWAFPRNILGNFWFQESSQCTSVQNYIH